MAVPLELTAARLPRLSTLLSRPIAYASILEAAPASAIAAAWVRRGALPF